MFRWVEMSLEALSRIKYAPDFKETLGQLPVKLSGLYDIIHTQIHQTETYGRSVAIMTLTWLLCAQRLLRAEELLAAVYAVDIEPSSESDEDDDNGKAGSPENDILRLCRNLVVLDSEQKTFRFAHQSVREYLLGKSEYTVMGQHALATKRCLDVYLTEPSSSSRVPRTVPQRNILKDYADAYWPVHYKYIEDCEFHEIQEIQEIQEKVSHFLMKGSRTSHFYIQWASGIRSKPDNENGSFLNQALGLAWGDRLGYKLLFAASTPETHISVACAFGLSKFLKEHALSIMELNRSRKVGRNEYTFLLVAAEEGHGQVVQMLLGKGADVNAQGGYYGNALQAASQGGYDQVVQMLLDKGADVNAQGGYYGNALQAASQGGYDQVVQMLLDKGADVNAQGGGYGNALQAASQGGYDHVVQMLLDKGADVNAQGGYYGNALQAASQGGHDQVVQMLLDKVADVNAQGGDYDNALYAALQGGHDHVMQMLLDKGADVNAQGRYYGNALQAASQGGHGQVVQMLLDKGADVNAQGGDYDNALYAALQGGHDHVVQMLLGKGADVNVQSGYYGNALQAASQGGYDQVVQMLLDKGADVNAQGGGYGNALQAASQGGYDHVVQMLLDKGADVNAQGGDYDNALYAASQGGHDQVVQTSSESTTSKRS
ncbi:hypothetical protein HO173_003320 [Letharia columbiana]|uniref:GPI inositol-deacylase winged helix domain-containing protein n=1 Tax=Letharia columbiana TaxID=112416 RepID=A0A8H6L7X2_9LECA|nr:uncharacterized protein HO173_003320 [Letharia columbiana]KAF6238813.1 hypothetical protein HO173_003320 [Letharia columbiana]